MKRSGYILPLKTGLKRPDIGNKARSLLFLKRRRLRIPETYVVSSRAFDDFHTRGDQMIPSLRSEISLLPEREWAIRSSTDIEDLELFSFAGQFLTLTGIRGTENILEAVREVWKSVDSNSVGNNYYSRAGIDAEKIRCAVIIQEMIPSVLAGVSFSRNPVTNFEETVIEAVEEAGENLVQKGINPLRWRFKGDILIEGSADFSLLSVIKNVARDTVLLKRHYRRDTDIEWVFNGTDLYYLQIRSVKKNNKLIVYSSRMVGEMLPGQIKPLVWDINIPLFNGTFISIISKLIGKTDVDPVSLVKSFYNRIYINTDVLGKLFNEIGLRSDSLEIMMLGDKNARPSFKPGLKVFKHTFRILKFIISMMRFERTFLKEFRRLEEKYREIRPVLSSSSIIDNYDALFSELFITGQQTIYLNIVAPLLMQFYNRKLRSKMAGINRDYELINFSADFPALDDLNPFNAMQAVRQKFEELPENLKRDFNSLEDFANSPEAEDFIAEFTDFMGKFGHLSDSGTDFSVMKWHEDPEKLLRMIISTTTKTSSSKIATWDELTASVKVSGSLKKLYYKAGRFRVFREQISSLYILGYGMFRYLFLSLGDEFVKRQIIGTPEDIFYLSRREVERIVTEIREGKDVENLSGLVFNRRKDFENSKDIILPQVIYGDEIPFAEHGKAGSYKGVGTSSGICRGRVKVVRGTSDFNQVADGDIIIIPFSDISWTPLLVRAGAIVSESGGMLSHCSIIARELGIPAITSAENACSVRNNAIVTVDGSNGILTVHDYE